MEKLTNIIEAILFASGKSVALVDIADKLGVTQGEVKRALKALREKYGEEGGIRLLEFNQKAQLASNPDYKDAVAAVLNPIREKELSRTLLECMAIIAYKQPVTRTEIELLRGVNSDYAVNVLLQLGLICPCGRKDAVGHPVLFGTTDDFLKRFKLGSLADLPNYEDVMEQLARPAESRDNYLYAREEYEEVAPAAEGSEGDDDDGETGGTPPVKERDGEVVEDGYAIPEFLQGLEDLVKIS